MPTFKIDELIDKQDSNEIVRDQLAAILTIEIDKQKDLAVIAGKNPIDWDIDIYLERLRPWELLSDENGEQLSETPLVNITFDNDVFDGKGSDTVGDQKVTGTFYLDCYSSVNAYQDSNGNWQSGDELTSKNADHVAKLVRNIVMAGIYNYLGLRGVVTKRYIVKREKFTPSDREGKFFENVIGTRLTLEVDYIESSPQKQGVDLELLIMQCDIGQDGLVSMKAEFDLSE